VSESLRNTNEASSNLAAHHTTTTTTTTHSHSPHSRCMTATTPLASRTLGSRESDERKERNHDERAVLHG